MVRLADLPEYEGEHLLAKNLRRTVRRPEPPRALWVSFPLGRPLGIPGDAPFQHRVIAAALELLERPEGPVLEDFPEDVPASEGDAVAACPVPFPPVLPDTGDREGALREELATLLPWYDLARRRRRGRTLVGLSSESPDANAGALGRLLDQGRPPSDLRWLKDAVADLKMLYLEAMTAQPGRHDAVAIEAQFWRETRLGAAILECYEAFQRSDDRRLQVLARILAPRNAAGGATGPVDRAVDGGEGTS